MRLEGECNRWTPYLYQQDFDTGICKIFRARCKTWTCPQCAQQNAINHYKRIFYGASTIEQHGFKQNFVTLTSHEKVRGWTASVAVWRKAWAKLTERARRKCKASKTPYHYVYITEAQIDGSLHIHGLFPACLDKRYWKNNARGCGLGYQVESEKLESANQAASYACKYIVKHMGTEHEGCRRIAYSSQFPDFKRRSNNGAWAIVPREIAIEDFIVTQWHVCHLDVKFDGKYLSFEDLN